MAAIFVEVVKTDHIQLDMVRFHYTFSNLGFIEVLSLVKNCPIICSRVP